MSDKLISVGVVLSKIEEERREIPFIADPYAAIRSDYDIGYNNALAMAKAIVMKAPAVDAVEVVRCKDCKFSKPAVNNDYIVCEIMECYCGLMKDDFCVCGKRREENAVD